MFVRFVIGIHNDRPFMPFNEHPLSIPAAELYSNGSPLLHYRWPFSFFALSQARTDFTRTSCTVPPTLAFVRGRAIIVRDCLCSFLLLLLLLSQIGVVIFFLVFCFSTLFRVRYSTQALGIQISHDARVKQITSEWENTKRANNVLCSFVWWEFLSSCSSPEEFLARLK